MPKSPPPSREKRKETGKARYVRSNSGFVGSLLHAVNQRTQVHKVPRKKSFVCASITLPAWEREYEQERGLVGTSYESATVEEVTPVGDGFLRLLVDTAVTCTAQQYRSEGQFLFLKPWGDEDGSIEPCCFNAPPGKDTMMHFFVPEESAVGAAALAGEMLEVSEVMGDGFQQQLSGPDFLDKETIVAVCGEQFSVPILLALRNAKRPSVIFFIASADGPFATQAREWAHADAELRQVQFCADDSMLRSALDDYVALHSSIAVLLSCDADLCEKVQDSLKSRLERHQFSTFTP